MAEGTRPLSASIAEGFSGLGRRIGDALSYITPDVYEKGDYAPQQWEKWYADTQPGGVHYERHQEFLRRLEPVLERRYPEFLAAMKAGWRPETPPQLPRTSRPALETIDKTFDVLRGRQVGNDPEARAWAGLFLDYMRDNSLGGRISREKDAATPEQYEQWSGQDKVRSGESMLATGIWDSPYRLTDSGKDSLERTIDYNLMTTFQTDPVHRPEYLKSGYGMGMIQNTVGMFNPFAVFSPSDIGMAAAQLDNVRTASPLSAVDNAIMWDDYSRERFAENPHSWNDRIAGSAVPQGSMLTAAGMERKTEGGDSLLGQATRYTTMPMLLPDPGSKLRQEGMVYQGREDRFTPIRSRPDKDGEIFEGEIARRRAGLSRDIRDKEADAWQGFSTVLPEKIKLLNKLTGLNIQPTYGSAAMNDLAMVVPGILGDPQNITQTALAAATGGVGALGSGLLNNLFEIPGEGGFNAAISLSNSPQSVNEYLFSSNPNVPLRTPDGRIPAPDSQEYDAALQADREDTKKMLGQAAEFNQYERQKAQRRQKPASFLESGLFGKP